MSFLVYPGQTVTRNQPVNFKIEDEQLFKTEFEKTFEPVYAEKYNEVLITPNGAVLKFLPKYNLYFSRSIRMNFFKKVKRTADFTLTAGYQLITFKEYIRKKKAIILTDNFSVMFFHWFGDILQKVEALCSTESDLRDYIILLPHTCNTPYARNTIKKYTFNYHFIEPDQLIKVDELIYIPLISPSGNFRSELMKNMRNRFRIQETNEILPTKIFITREHAPNRTIQNENELKPILRRFGYTILSMEKIPFEKQMQYAASASKLISLHGAGLTHMLWMKEKSTVLEIRLNNDAHNNCYFSLASDLNLRYHYLLAEKMNPKLSTQKTNFMVNAEEFEDALLSIE